MWVGVFGQNRADKFLDADCAGVGLGASFHKREPFGRKIREADGLNDKNAPQTFGDLATLASNGSESRDCLSAASDPDVGVATLGTSLLVD